MRFNPYGRRILRFAGVYSKWPHRSLRHCHSTSEYVPRVIFTQSQLESCVEEPNISALVSKLTERREFFYGIEITEKAANEPNCLDFNDFLPILPKFVSIVWLGEQYWNVEPIREVQALKLAQHLEPYIPVMPHLTIYRLTEQRLSDLLALRFRNLLAMRGDFLDKRQKYLETVELVCDVQSKVGDSVSLNVAGYPEGYTRPGSGPECYISSMEHLKNKINSGTDLIITQTCYSIETIIKFIKDCRRENIKVPIIIGLMIPHSFEFLKVSERITGVSLPWYLESQVQRLKDEPAKVLDFFIGLNICIIQEVLKADLGVFGVQFFTINRFEPLKLMLKELRNRDILKEPKHDNE